MSRKTPPFFSPGLPFRILFTVALALAVHLSFQNLGEISPGTPGPTLVLPTPMVREGSLTEKADQITAALEGLSLPRKLPSPVEEPQGAGNLQWVHRRYIITTPKQGMPDSLERLFDPLSQSFPEAVVQIRDLNDGQEVSIGIDGLRTHTITFRWLQRPPRVVIIVDGLGEDILSVRRLLELNLPLTYSVVPFQPFSSLVAERVSLMKREVLAHLPTDGPAGGREVPARPLRASMSKAEIDATLDATLAELPQARGLLGRLPTTLAMDSKRMDWLLAAVQRHGLYLVEDRPPDAGDLCDAARTRKIECQRCEISLDDTDDEGTIRSRFASLIERARTEGLAIGIARPGAAVIAVLEAELPKLKDSGIDLVSAAQAIDGERLS